MDLLIQLAQLGVLAGIAIAFSRITGILVGMKASKWYVVTSSVAQLIATTAFCVLGFRFMAPLLWDSITALPYGESFLWVMGGIAVVVTALVWIQRRRKQPR